MMVLTGNKSVYFVVELLEKIQKLNIQFFFKWLVFVGDGYFSLYELRVVINVLYFFRINNVMLKVIKFLKNFSCLVNG